MMSIGGLFFFASQPVRGGANFSQLRNPPLRIGGVLKAPTASITATEHIDASVQGTLHRLTSNISMRGMVASVDGVLKPARASIGMTIASDGLTFDGDPLTFDGNTLEFTP